MAFTLTFEPQLYDVRLDITVPAGADRLAVSRVGPSGTLAYVRGYQEASVEPGLVIVRDFEAPIGVPLTYSVQTWAAPAGAVTTETATITIASAGCAGTWLTDLARAGNTQPIEIEALEELDYDVPAAVHSVIGRRDPIVSGDIARTPSFELSFLTADDEEREQARACLGNGVPVLLRTGPEVDIGNLYFSVTHFREQRITALGTEQSRRFVVSAVQVTRPDPGLYQPLAPAIYSYVEETFASYAVLLTERASYDAVAYDWAGSAASDAPPWPPQDL